MPDKPTTTVRAMAEADWDELRFDVMYRIAFLQQMSESMHAHDTGPDATEETKAINHRLANDLLLPAVDVLAEFCARVTIDEEEQDDQTPARL